MMVGVGCFAGGGSVFGLGKQWKMDENQEGYGRRGSPISRKGTIYGALPTGSDFIDDDDASDGRNCGSAPPPRASKNSAAGEKKAEEALLFWAKGAGLL